MTTLSDRDATALVVIDVQNGVVAGAHRREQVVATIAELVARARRAAVPVVWVRHANEQLVPGSDAWQYVDELVALEAEPVVDKTYDDAFEDTDFEAVLARLRIGRLIVTGAQTDVCIRSTLHGALVRGYDAILVGDADTTEDLSAWGAPPPDQVIAHTNLYWGQQRAPGREAGTVAAAEVDFSPVD